MTGVLIRREDSDTHTHTHTEGEHHMKTKAEIGVTLRQLAADQQRPGERLRADPPQSPQKEPTLPTMLISNFRPPDARE